MTYEYDPATVEVTINGKRIQALWDSFPPTPKVTVARRRYWARRAEYARRRMNRRYGRLRWAAFISLSLTDIIESVRRRLLTQRGCWDMGAPIASLGDAL